MAGTTLRLLRPLIRISSHLAPATAGRLAFRAFCTPQRGKQGATRGGAVKSVAARLAAAQHVSVPFPCGSLAAYVFNPTPVDPAGGMPPTVVMLHGWTGAAAFMTAFVAPLLKSGFRVVAYDLPAHGSSTGRELNIPLGVASLAAIERAFGPLHSIVTHSFGGSIAIAGLAGTVPVQPVVRARRLAMIAAPSSLAQVSRNFGSTVGLSRRGQAAFERRIHSVAGVPLDAFEGRDQLASIAIPTLVLHCRDDKEVGFANAEALAAAGVFATLEAVSGFGHRRILQARPVVDAVVNFIAAAGSESAAASVLSLGSANHRLAQN